MSTGAPICPTRILDDTSWAVTCPICGTQFRLDPQLTYLDQKPGLFLSAIEADSVY